MEVTYELTSGRLQRQDPIRPSGIFDAELHAAGCYDGQLGWSQSINGEGHFHLAKGAGIGSTMISGFVTKALTLPANLVDQSFKALLDRAGQPLQVIIGILNSGPRCKATSSGAVPPGNLMYLSLSTLCSDCIWPASRLEART